MGGYLLPAHKNMRTPPGGAPLERGGCRVRYNSYCSARELRQMGFRALGERVLISRDARIFSPETISIGSNVLIDAFTIMNGNITIGDHVHLSSHCEVYSSEGSEIVFGDYCGISSHVSFYSQTDDYLGPYMNNPTVPPRFRNVSESSVILEKHVLIATQSVVLPGVRLGEGCSFGACSLINKSTPPGGVYVGAPCRRIHERDVDGIRRMAESLEAEERLRLMRRMK